MWINEWSLKEIERREVFETLISLNTETPGRDLFKIGIQRRTDNITVAINVGVWMADIPIGNETVESGIIGKNSDWINVIG